MENGWELRHKAQLGDSHPIEAGIDWLELSHPSQLVSETAACTVSSGKRNYFQGWRSSGYLRDVLPYTLFPGAGDSPL